MNNITVAGRVGRDAEVRHLGDGTAVASFSLADDQGRDKPTIWWSCNLWGKRAEVLSQYIRKGAPVTVSGTVSEREWTDREGNTRKNMEIRVSDIALQSSKGDDQQPRQSAAAPKPAPQPEPQQAPQNSGGGGEYGASDFQDDDIPFIFPQFNTESQTSKQKRMRKYDF